MPDAQAFLATLAEWAADHDDLAAVALVGSHARGTARPDSDVDVVILVEEPRRYLDDTGWIGYFGAAGAVEHEDYGMVQSLRAIYDGLEVEFGLTAPRWAGTEGLDSGTRDVVSDGCRIIFDRHGVLAALMRTVAGSAERRSRSGVYCPG